jgi:hypothetical protein
LSDLIVQNYFGNYEIVDGLAQDYGFKYFFVIPPRLHMGDKRLTPEEQWMKRKLERDAEFSKLYTAVLGRIETELAKDRNFYSMTHVFDDVDSLVWIDASHPTPMGNRIIATRMLDIIQERYSAEK